MTRSYLAQQQEHWVVSSVLMVFRVAEDDTSIWRPKESVKCAQH